MCTFRPIFQLLTLQESGLDNPYSDQIIVFPWVSGTRLHLSQYLPLRSRGKLTWRITRWWWEPEPQLRLLIGDAESTWHCRVNVRWGSPSGMSWGARFSDEYALLFETNADAVVLEDGLRGLTRREGRMGGMWNNTTRGWEQEEKKMENSSRGSEYRYHNWYG